MVRSSASNLLNLVAKHATEHTDPLASLRTQGSGEINLKFDPANQLEAIIAIHSTQLGPAAGGCRCRPYLTVGAAVKDALRLARGMSYKAAIAGLPIGGGKAVLIHPKKLRDREAFFESFGDFVETLNGRYITAVDSGTGVEDMDIVARRTRHVFCSSENRGGSGDPSHSTAKGVRMGIEAAVKHVMDRDSLDGIHVAIQGTGHVGYPLAGELYERGALLTVADTLTDHMQRCADEFGAKTVAPESIYDVRCDVFSPCALGAVVNDDTIKRFQTRIIAGAANNQLEDERHGQLLHEHGILYAPDYVINAGGIIHVMLNSPAEREQRLSEMTERLAVLFARSAQSGRPPFRQADVIAAEILSPGQGNE